MAHRSWPAGQNESGNVDAGLLSHFSKLLIGPVLAAVPSVRVLHQPTRAVRHVNHVKKELWCEYHV